MIISPLISLWIGFSMPAALCLYWIAQNLLSMVQEFICGKLLKKDYEKAAAARAEQERLEKAYPGEAPIFPPRSDSRALKREAHEIEEELREIHTDEAIEDAILEEKALEAPVQEETEVVSAGEESEAPYAEESEAEDDTDKTKE